MEQKQIVGVGLAFLIFITTIAATYLFSTLNLDVSAFLTINIFPIIEAMVSVNGIVFVIVVALPIALILLVGEEFDYYHALILAETGYLLGAIVGAFAFGLVEWILPLIFAALGIAWAIKWLRLKEKELKSKFKFSAGSGAAEKIIVVSLIGFVIFVGLSGFAQKEALGDSFANDLMDITIGDQDTFKDSVTELAIGISVKSQQAVVNSITDLSSYQALSGKSDIDVLTFVAQVDALKSEINQPNYSDSLKEAVAADSGDFDITSQLIEKLPLMEIREHIWIVYAIFALLLAHMIGTLIVKNIASGYYVLFKVIYGKLFQTKKVETFESKVEKQVEEEMKVAKKKPTKKVSVKGPFDKDDLPD